MPVSDPGGFTLMLGGEVCNAREGTRAASSIASSLRNANLHAWAQWISKGAPCGLGHLSM